MIKQASKKELRAKRHMRTKDIKGTSECPRISVFRSNKYLYVQLVDDVNHKTLVSLSTAKFDLPEGKNVAAATKLGEEVAKLCKENKIEKAVFDRSGYIYHGRIKALAEAMRENGVKF